MNSKTVENQRETRQRTHGDPQKQAAGDTVYEVMFKLDLSDDTVPFGMEDAITLPVYLHNDPTTTQFEYCDKDLQNNRIAFLENSADVENEEWINAYNNLMADMDSRQATRNQQDVLRACALCHDGDSAGPDKCTKCSRFTRGDASARVPNTSPGAAAKKRKDPSAQKTNIGRKRVQSGQSQAAGVLDSKVPPRRSTRRGVAAGAVLPAEATPLAAAAAMGHESADASAATEPDNADQQRQRLAFLSTFFYLLSRHHLHDLTVQTDGEVQQSATEASVDDLTNFLPVTLAEIGGNNSSNTDRLRKSLTHVVCCQPLVDGGAVYDGQPNVKPEQLVVYNFGGLVGVGNGAHASVKQQEQDRLRVAMHMYMLWQQSARLLSVTADAANLPVFGLLRIGEQATFLVGGWSTTHRKFCIKTLTTLSLGAIGDVPKLSLLVSRLGLYMSDRGRALSAHENPSLALTRAMFPDGADRINKTRAPKSKPTHNSGAGVGDGGAAGAAAGGGGGDDDGEIETAESDIVYEATGIDVDAPNLFRQVVARRSRSVWVGTNTSGGLVVKLFRSVDAGKRESRNRVRFARVCPDGAARPVIELQHRDHYIIVTKRGETGTYPLMFGPSYAKQVALVTAKMVSQLARAGLAYGNWKAENIAWINGSLQAIDFGNLCDLGTEGPWGTDCYMAPEVLAGGPVTVASEMYSVGCTVLRVIPAYSYCEECDQHIGVTGSKRDLIAHYYEEHRMFLTDNRLLPLLKIVEPLLSEDPAMRPSPEQFYRTVETQAPWS